MVKADSWKMGELMIHALRWAPNIDTSSSFSVEPGLYSYLQEAI